MWSYLITRLLAITIVVIPLLTGLFWALVLKFYKPNEITSFGSYFRLGWGYTIFVFTWTYLAFVLVPYSWAYIGKDLRRVSFFYKFILFYSLMVIMGLLLPYASIIGLFLSHGYPRVLILYFLLTITICPLCNVFLNTIVKNKLS